MISKLDEVKRIIDEILSAPGVESVVLSSADGLPIASSLASSEAEEKLSALTAVISEVASKTLIELEKGELDWIAVYARDGSGIILIGVANVGFLCVTFRANAKLGILLHVIKSAKKKLEGLGL